MIISSVFPSRGSFDFRSIPARNIYSKTGETTGEESAELSGYGGEEVIARSRVATLFPAVF
jgi:hypothetical protein